jgi:hypothetical protein
MLKGVRLLLVEQFQLHTQGVEGVGFVEGVERSW